MISNDTGAVKKKQFPSDIVGSYTNKVYDPTTIIRMIL